MTNIFDDGLSAEDLAISLGMAEEIADEERERFRWFQDEEQFDSDESDDDDLEWFEKD